MPLRSRQRRRYRIPTRTRPGKGAALEPSPITPNHHRVLARQLKKLGLDSAQPPPNDAAWQHFLERIDQAYEEADQDRYLLERSLVISSREMQELHQRRQSSEGEMAAERNRQRAVISALGVGLCTLDPKGRVRSINPEGQRLLGCAEEDLLGTCFFERVEASWDGPDPFDCADTRISTLVASGQPYHEQNGVFAGKDGIDIPVSYTLTPLMEEGTVEGVVVVFFNVTKRKRFEQEMIKAREKAEELSRLKSTFLNNMSHEIRTPLTAIIGFSAILSEDGSPGQKELIDLIELSGKRLLNTLNAVLDLSMLEAGSLCLDNEWFDVVRVVQEKVAGLRMYAREKGIGLDIVTPAPRLPIFLDRTCLDRILTHLIDNAIKFTQEGKVTVVIGTDAGRLSIRVEDTGVGIRQAFQSYLFDDFKQESTGLTRSHEGVGLGLAVTKRMVTLMGGKISVESTKGHGSVFEITFVQPLLNNVITRKAHPREETRPRSCILVVEDAPEIELLVGYMLGETYDVVTTEHEEGALRLAGQKQFDLVLMDINLGGVRTGIDVMRSLRKLPAYADIPIVAMTAYALLEDRARFLAAGFNGYLSKPFTEHQAHTVIQQLLPKNGKA